jgi:hypothetical protein
VTVGAIVVDAVGQNLYWHGGRYGVDGGLSIVDLAARGDSLALTAGSESTERNRNLLFWSASGETLVSTLCDMESCSVDSVSTETRMVHRLDLDFAAGSGSDRYLLGYRVGHGSTDHQADRPWEVYDLSREVISAIAETWVKRTADGFFVADDTVLVSGLSTDGSTYSIVRVDLESGVETLLFSQPEDESVLHLRRYDLGSDFPILGGKESEFGPNGGNLSILDLASGHLIDQPAVIGAIDQ